MEQPSPEVLAAQASQLNDRHHYAEALAAIHAAIEAEGGLTPPLDLIRAHSLLGLERFQEAYSCARNLLTNGGEGIRPKALVAKARILRRSSRYVDDALEAALEAAAAAALQGEESRPYVGEAHLEAARIFAMKRCPELANRELDAANAALPDDPRVTSYRAAVLMDFDERPEAKKQLEQLLATDVAGAAYLASAGLAHLEYVMGDFDAAHAHLDAISPAPEGALWPRRVRAMVLEAQQRWQEAAEAHAALCANSPHGDGLLRYSYRRAVCMYKAGAIADALEVCEQITEASEGDDYHADLAARMAKQLANPEVGHKPRKRLAEFPSVAQLRDHCGPASCELYLRYFGLTDSQIEIARAIKHPDGGTPVYKMRRYLDAAGFKTRRVAAELQQIRRFIDAGIPVIMEEAYSESTHVAVAIGYDDARELLEVQDPMTHQVRETFYENLAEIRNYSNHGALVAVPEADRDRVLAMEQVGAEECRYMSLVDEAWAALDEDRAEEGDALVKESIDLHREYELAWLYRFRRARDAMKEDASTENHVALHRVLGEITAIWPDDEWPQQMLGEALYFDDRIREALVAFERARDRDPNDAHNWSMIADCHLAMGDQNEAYDALVEALARNPAHIRANENLADLARRRGRNVMAWALNDAARELHPGNPFNHAVHGQLLDGAGRAEEAVDAYQRALEIDPEREWIITLHSQLLARLKRLDEAVAGLESILERRPDAVRTKIDLADMLYVHGRPAQAIEVCESMIAEDESIASAHAIMGAAMAKQGDLDGALERLHRALALRPTYAWVYSQMGAFLLDAGREIEAIQAFAAALGLSGGNPSLEYDLGEALVRAGYAEEGARHLRSAAIHGDLDESQLRRIGEIVVDTGIGSADAFFREVAEHRANDLAVLRAHAHTLLEVLWAPSSAEPVLESLAAISPEDPYALVSRGEDLAYAALETEAEGEKLMRLALEKEPALVYGRRMLADFLVERGRFGEALEVLEPLGQGFHNDRARVRALLGLDRVDEAREVIAAFLAEYGQDGRPNPGAMMLEYRIARHEWDWHRALEIAEGISREMHERDDDGRLDKWEEERFECLARLGEEERALRFGESQAVDAESLGRLAYTAHRADRLELAARVAERALRLDPNESMALAVTARTYEVGGEIERAIDVWEQLGEVDPEWHTWQEQLARIAIGRGDMETATARAEEGVVGGHLCPWSFGVRAQVRFLRGDRAGAIEDLERAWALAAPEDRANEGHDVWALRAALAGDRATAEEKFATYLASDAPRSSVDEARVEHIRKALQGE